MFKIVWPNYNTVVIKWDVLGKFLKATAEKSVPGIFDNADELRHSEQVSNLMFRYGNLTEILRLTPRLMGLTNWSDDENIPELFYRASFNAFKFLTDLYLDTLSRGYPSIADMLGKILRNGQPLDFENYILHHYKPEHHIQIQWLIDSITAANIREWTHISLSPNKAHNQVDTIPINELAVFQSALTDTKKMIARLLSDHIDYESDFLSSLMYGKQ